MGHQSSIDLKLIENKFMNQTEHFGDKKNIFDYYLQLIIIIESGLMILLQHFVTKRINCNLISGNDNIKTNTKKNEILKTNKKKIFFEKICEILKILEDIECNLK